MMQLSRCLLWWHEKVTADDGLSFIFLKSSKCCYSLRQRSENLSQQKGGCLRG